MTIGIDAGQTTVKPMTEMNEHTDDGRKNNGERQSADKQRALMQPESPEQIIPFDESGFRDF